MAVSDSSKSTMPDTAARSARLAAAAPAARAISPRASTSVGLASDHDVTAGRADGAPDRDLLEAARHEVPNHRVDAGNRQHQRERHNAADQRRHRALVRGRQRQLLLEVWTSNSAWRASTDQIARLIAATGPAWAVPSAPSVQCSPRAAAGPTRKSVERRRPGTADARSPQCRRSSSWRRAAPSPARIRRPSGFAVGPEPPRHLTVDDRDRRTAGPIVFGEKTSGLQRNAQHALHNPCGTPEEFRWADDRVV